MTAYADTSALVKLVLEEAGSEDMHALAAEEPIIAVSVGYVELRAALAMAIRAGRIAEAARSDTIAAAYQVWATVDEVAVDRQLIEDAAGLTDRFSLRAYDAVQLAGLLQSGGPEEVSFACWDDDLRRAASRLGYALMPR